MSRTASLVTVSPKGGLIKGARRPAGWIAPGPRPAADPPVECWPGPDEDLCFLAGDWRILQRTDGHRWSMDDLVTAWLGTTAVREPPKRTLDLGCGIGTVLLFTAWRFPEARAVGIEAQDVSAGLARRSVLFNGASHRVEVRHGDFRDPTLTPEGAVYELVTGTPPYFPSGTGTESDHVQRAPCRFEHRGGVEAYAETAARLLAPGGVFVACEAALTGDRVRPALEAAGLELERWLDVVPKVGKPPLVVVFAARRRGEAGAPKHETLIIRDANGQRTPEFSALRGDLGMPP